LGMEASVQSRWLAFVAQALTSQSVALW